MWHLLHICPSQEDGPSSVDLLQVSSFPEWVTTGTKILSGTGECRREDVCVVNLIHNIYTNKGQWWCSSTVRWWVVGKESKRCGALRWKRCGDLRRDDKNTGVSHKEKSKFKESGTLQLPLGEPVAAWSAGVEDVSGAQKKAPPRPLAEDKGYSPQTHRPKPGTWKKEFQVFPDLVRGLKCTGCHNCAVC